MSQLSVPGAYPQFAQQWITDDTARRSLDTYIEFVVSYANVSDYLRERAEERAAELQAELDQAHAWNAHIRAYIEQAIGLDLGGPS